MLSGQLKAALLGGMILLLAGGTFYAGCWYGGTSEKVATAAVRAELSACQGQVSDAKAYGEGVDAARAQIEQELLQLKNEKAQNEELYQDSLAVIRGMLPERAERELARYYQNRR